MAAVQDHDSRARASLGKLAADLAELEGAINGTQGGVPLPLPLFEVFLRLAAAAEVCEGLLTAHATSVARVSDTTLAEVAATLRLVREITTALMRIALDAADALH
jgi:hypothetical protein